MFALFCPLVMCRFVAEPGQAALAHFLTAACTSDFLAIANQQRQAERQDHDENDDDTDIDEEQSAEGIQQSRRVLLEKTIALVQRLLQRETQTRIAASDALSAALHNAAEFLASDGPGDTQHSASASAASGSGLFQSRSMPTQQGALSF